VSLTFADSSQAARKTSSAILPVEPLKAFISKIKVLLFIVVYRHYDLSFYCDFLCIISWLLFDSAVAVFILFSVHNFLFSVF